MFAEPGSGSSQYIFVVDKYEFPEKAKNIFEYYVKVYAFLRMKARMRTDQFYSRLPNKFLESVRSCLCPEYTSFTKEEGIAFEAAVADYYHEFEDVVRTMCP